MRLSKIILFFLFFFFGANLLVSQDTVKKDDEKEIKDKIEKNEGKIPRSVLIVPFYNMTPRKSEFNFLSEALRDSITSRLQNLDQFYFVNSLEVTNAMRRLGFEPESMNEINNALRLASHLKADILVVGKFYILENKVMISTRSYDMINFEDIVSSVEGNTGVDIFVLVDAISSDMARKMEEKYPKLDEFKSSNALFASNYSGIKLGDNYESLKNLLSNSKFPSTYYPDKKMMFLRGYISEAFKTNLIVLYFDNNNKLSNIFIDALSVKQEQRKVTITDQKHRMIRVFGEEFKDTGDENYFWEGKENSFELINRFTHQGEMRMFYHFFSNKHKIEYSTMEKDINFFKKDGFEFSVGAGLNSLIYEKIATNLVFHEDGNYDEMMNISIPIKFGIFLPISFSYVYNRHSIGFNLSINYQPGFIYKYVFTEPIYFLNTFNVSLSLRMKFVDKKNIYMKNVFEIGAMLETEWLYDRDNTDSKYYKRNPDASGKDGVRADFYIAGGPIFRVGREMRYGNFTYEPYFVFGATFGTENFNYKGKLYDKQKIKNEELYKRLNIEPVSDPYFAANIFIGHEIRFSFYKVFNK
ncbi:MAG TPA: hypothetical protein PK771_12035 [Spirochaetota bacterium]|nr:hypothetical protein [Spirochaetota bacterium]